MSAGVLHRTTTFRGRKRRHAWDQQYTERAAVHQRRSRWSIRAVLDVAHVPDINGRFRAGAERDRLKSVASRTTELTRHGKDTWPPAAGCRTG